MTPVRALQWMVGGISRKPGGRPSARGLRVRRSLRRAVAGLLGPVMAAGTSLVPVALAAAVATGMTAATVVSAIPAKAASGTPVLVILVNGESTAPETAVLTSAGYTVTPVTPSTLEAMNQATFQGYAAVIIGDPSTGGSCPSSWQPTTTTLGSNWEGWVHGNVAVLGTAPALPGTSASKALITDTAEYAAAQPGSGVTQTGLYLSLDCGYSTAPSGTAVSLLNGVEGIGTAGGVSVNGSVSCTDSGTVNSWEADSAGTFGGITTSSLVAGAPGWPSPACPVQEAFDSWPAGFTAVAYDAAGDARSDFTASDGATGQPYVLLGSPASSGTLDLAPSQGGEVPIGTSAGGAGNAADGGVSQALAAGSVNTENGDLTQSDTDLSIPTFGPPLSFSRTYDSDTAQQQTQTGSPGQMGYGWTDNWASLITAGRPLEGDIYTLDGLRTAPVNGVSATGQPLDTPGGEYVSGGNTYIADTAGNRIEEIAGTAGTQWGIPMTAGDMYTIAGSSTGMAGEVPSGTLNTSSSDLLDKPQGVWMDNSGDLFIADSGNDRVLELAASSTAWGAGSDGLPATTTADDLYVVAGTGTAGVGADSKAAYQSALSDPTGVFIGGNAGGSLYIADSGNNRIQMISQVSTTHWGISMPTAYNVYTIAGSAAGTAGTSPNGRADTSSLLSGPENTTVDSSGNLYIADTLNNRIVEIPKATGAQWGDGTLTLNDVYTIAGSAAGTSGSSGDGAAASGALLNGPQDITWTSPSLYIADTGNNRVREIAGSAHTEFGVTESVNDIYTIAGTGTAGYNGDGITSITAQLQSPTAAMTSGGNLFLTDSLNNRLREVSSSTSDISTIGGNGLTLSTNGIGGPATEAALNDPMQEAFDARGDTYIADAGNNRVVEIASYSHSQYGITMTAGDVYDIAGQANGQAGCQCDGAPAYYAYLDHPTGIAIDAAGDLYIADTGNNRIQEVPNSSGIQWSQNMSIGDMYTVAGNQYGTAGYSGDGGAAGAALLDVPNALTLDQNGDIYISDSYNNRVQEIYAAGGENWGNTSWTAGDIYTIAGSATGAHGSSGDGGPGTSSLLYGVGGLALDASGNLYIGDGGNNRVQELAAATHSQWGQTMTANDIYTLTGGYGTTGDGGPASQAKIIGAPSVAVDASGDLYIADEQNNRIQEIANVTGTQWGQSMTAGDMYTVAGSATGASGNSGDGGLATTALMANTESISLDPEGDLYITDNANDTVREAASAIPNAIPPAPNQTSSLAIAPTGAAPGGITVTQPGGAQVTFWAKSGGSCPTQYDAAGSYCVLPQDVGATLTDNSGTYSFSPSPGSPTYSYMLAGATGSLTSEIDTAGDKLTVNDNYPSPGTSTSTTTAPVTSTAITCPSSAASCQTLISASGRALVVGYNGPSDTGQITSVTDPMNRTWIYGYSNSELTSVTDPMTNKTTYTYGIGSGNTNPLLANDMLTITEPDAQASYPSNSPDADPGADTVIAYDNAGQVTSQTDPMGWKTTLNYCANSAAGACMNTATGTGFVTATDPDGNQTIYDYDQGTLAAQSAWTKTSTSLTLTTENDAIPDTTAATGTNSSGGTLQDTSTTDGDDNTTTYQYDTDGNATQAIAPGANGTPATTTTAYTSGLQEDSCDGTADAASGATCGQDSGPPSVTAGTSAAPLAISPPTTAPPVGLTYTLNDSNGNQLYSTTGVYPAGGSYEYSQTTYQLFNYDSVTLNSTKISCTYTAPSPSLPCASINADGTAAQLKYDTQGDLAQSSAPDGNAGSQLATTSYTYDADGEELTTVAPDGNLTGAISGNYTTTTAYNPDGHQTTVTQGNGSGYTDTPRATSYGYDGDGNQVTVKDPRGYTTATSWNADDEATLVTNPDNDSALTCYDGDGNTAQTVPPVGVAANGLSAGSCPTAYPAGYGARLATDATVSTFNALGQQTEQTTPAPAGQTSPPYETTSYTYDGNGNLLTTTAPPATNGGSNQATVNTWNPAGQLTSQTSGYGSVDSTVSYCYDPDGDTTSVVYPDGNAQPTSGLTYANGTVTGLAACSASSPWTVATTPQSSYQTTYSYDSAGEAVSTISPATAADPSGAQTSLTYDPDGNKLTSTDPAHVTTTWTYSPLNQPTTVSYSGSSAHSASYSYDASGNQTGMTDATGSPAYGYDTFGELASVQNGASQTTQYGYNADGQVSSITYPLPSTATWTTNDAVSYGYDNADQLTSATDFNGHQITIGNTADDLPNSETLGSTGDTITTTYAPTDSPSVITLKNSAATLQSFSYSDGPDGTVLAETDGPGSSSPASYSYDAESRVTSMTPAGSSTADNYAFDASGNLTTLPGGAAGTYDDASELTKSALAGTTTTYTYNNDGEQLTAIQGITTTASATWNGAGQLTTYSDPTADMTATTYDGDGLRASTSSTPAGGSAATEAYVWKPGQIPQLLMDSSNAYIYADSNTPAEQVNLATGTITYLNADALGSVRGTISSTGALTGTANYDAWGNPLTAGGLTAVTPFGYAGAYTDPDGLIYLDNRYFNPQNGQFISVDPLIAQTLDAYAYASDNPVSDTDPTGLGAETDPTSPPVAGTGKAVFTNPHAYAPGPAPAPAPAPSPRTEAENGFGGCKNEPPRLVFLNGCIQYARALARLDHSSTDQFLAMLIMAWIPGVDEVEALAVIDDGGADAALSDSDLAARYCESFTPNTMVLLASGKAIPINQVRVGDKVLATNVKTGKTSAETVTEVIVRHDNDKYNLKVRVGHRTAIIHATRNHLFWDLTRNKWVRAVNLKRGDSLRTSNGMSVAFVSGRTPVQSKGWMWDLSVPGGNDHDFYVDVIKVGILVHNCPISADTNATVRDVLRTKRGSIMQVKLPPGSPSWAEIQDMTMGEIRAAAKARVTGFKIFLKVLTDQRFDK